MRYVALGLAGLACLVVGCGKKLDFSATAPVTPEKPWTQIIDAFSKETKLTVEFTSSEPVHVFVLPEKDLSEEMESKLQDGKAPPSVTQQLNSKGATLTATAPKGEEIRVYVVAASGKDAQLTIQVRN